ncbi:iron permease FTR1 family protein [Xylariales sp. PMI_506]|nr:iron permease FTR1 family protein [Xylariales sp. PMI_506]
MADELFAVPVFFIVFRETLETGIIVSVLLAFLKQTLGKEAELYRSLRNQVWIGAALGLLICLVISAGIIALFYTTATDYWEPNEYYYEGVFAMFSSIVITIMGAALLRIGKMQEKWRMKLAKSIEQSMDNGGSVSFKQLMEKYAMFLLPFLTVLREGIEAIVFIAGVSFSAPPSAIPLPALAGIAAGSVVGWFIYKGGSGAKLRAFLVISTCVLYLVAAGLFTRAVWFFEQQSWNNKIGGDAAELGDGPGSYDIDNSVWHVNCCNPQRNGGGPWGIFNALLGWQNSATYGSVIAYNVYWIVVISSFFLMGFKETKGHFPLMKSKTVAARSN